MAVITKGLKNEYVKELFARFEALTAILHGRELKNAEEGCPGRKHWAKPEMHCSIDTLKLHLAIGDFKTILAELNKLK